MTFSDGHVSRSKSILLRSAAILLLSGMVTDAFAAAPDDTATAEASSEGIGDIVVTAQKRLQSVQDVGITMSVVSSATLVERNVISITDLVDLVPNLQANSGAGQVQFSVRGIGTNEFSANLDSPIAVNVNEIYQSKAFMTGLLLFDIDRVEVLKGPQGTLFGRNATGGAVNFFTKQPEADLKLGGTIGYDNYETVRGEGYLNVPLSSGLSARLSGMYVDQNRGWYRNLLRDEREGFERKWALRGQLLWQDAATKILLTGHFGRDTGEVPSYEGFGIFTPESLAAGSPQFCAPYLDGSVKGATPECVRGTDGLNPGDNNAWTSTNNLSHKRRNKGYGLVLKVEHNFGWSSLVSQTSYQYYTRDQREDSDGSPIDTVDIYYYNRIKQFTQEVRLSSNGNRRWNYVLGAYYEHDNFKNGDYLLVGGGAAPGYYSPFTQTVDAFAVFLHNEVQLTDDLDLIAGVRHSWESIGIDGGTYAGTGIGDSPERPTAIVAPLALADQSRNDRAATFKIGMEWKPNITSDFVDKLMIYGHVSTGFRSGSFNAEFSASPAELTSLAPEKITAYEAGFKSALANRKLQVNGAFFHYAFTDGFVNVDTPSSPLPITINAAGINTYGAELDLVWRPIEQLTLSMAGGWLSSKIASNISVSGNSVKGNRTVQSPEWTYNAQILFSQPLGNALKLSASSDASWRSSQYFEVTNSPVSRDGGYWVVNGRLALGDQDDRWTVSVWGKNLTKTAYRTYVNDLPGFGWVLNIYGPPRSYGLALSFKY